MTNLEKYNKSFIEAFEISDNDLESAEYQNVKGWDSVGHMLLISILEREFGIMMKTDDIIEMGSYKKGKEILLKYSITI